MRNELYRLLMGLQVVLGFMTSSVYANERAKFSPALEHFPTSLIQSLKNCTARRIGSRYAESREVDLVEAWFVEFTNPAYTRLFDEVNEPLTELYSRTLMDVNRRMNDVRQLADYRTEQALISLVDALIRRYATGSRCQIVSSVLLMRIAEQRDRAWVWAEVVNRHLNMAESRWQVDRAGREVEESMRELTRSHEAFARYMDWR